MPDGICVWATVDAKARTLAAVNRTSIQEAFGSPDPALLTPEVLSKAWFDAGRWWVSQHVAYRYATGYWPRNWDARGCFYVLLTPDPVGYATPGWLGADLEEAAAYLLDVHTSRPTPELERVIAAHIAPRGQRPFRAYAPDGRLRGHSARIAWGNDAWHNRVQTITHRGRNSALTFTGIWTWRRSPGRTGPLSTSEKSELAMWAEDLALAGERLPGWACPVATPAGPCPCRSFHIDKWKNTRRGWSKFS